MTNFTSKLFTLDGRASRTEFFAILFLSYLSAVIIGGGILAITGSIFLFGLVYLVCICPLVGVKIRRLHDLGLSAWWGILFIPLSSPLKLFSRAKEALRTHDEQLAGITVFLFVAFLVTFSILAFCPGTKGDNQFGSPTKPQGQ